VPRYDTLISHATPSPKPKTFNFQRKERAMDASDYLDQRAGSQYESLSFKDLLEAREAYHVHLMNHPHVVATAVGRYLIRVKDSWPGPHRKTNVKGTGPRTLGNSEVRPYSWPAILVFIDQWVDSSEFAKGKRYQPDDMVPRTLFLPDGRKVPVCVVVVDKVAKTEAVVTQPTYPLNNIGGGHPIIATVQGREHVATVGCLVSDGHKVFALTNRHVVGDVGEELCSRLNGEKTPIGRASAKQISRLGFSEVYPEWPGKKVYLNMDVGLIELDDLSAWTARIRDMPTMGPLVDLSATSLSLSLIGCRVVGTGAISGRMEGEICALHYRYKSVGGFEYLADFLLGPRKRGPTSKAKSKALEKSNFLTRPGDSGTVWLFDPGPQDSTASAKAPLEFRPFGMQWGAQIFNDGGTASYALVTCLATICNLLEVDVVRDWNLDQTDTWGAIGHFSIAASVVGCLSRPSLKKLMAANADIISPSKDEISSSEFKGMGTADFVPLADVPDMFWKPRIAKQGFNRYMEGPNHFADMDQPNEDGQTLLDLTASEAFIDPDKWNAFYDSIKDLTSGEPIEAKHRGLLPFRVWQIFNEMVRFAKAGKFPEFVCAAGVLTHYVGDACQPLHISYLHDGDPERQTTRTVNHRDKPPEEVPEALGAGVHAAYEDAMISANRDAILQALASTPKVKAAELISDGFEAAKATIRMMKGVFKRLPPSQLVEFYISNDAKPKQMSEDLWAEFGTGTKACMKEGVHLLAVLWQSAWVAGGAESKFTSTSAKALTQSRAMKICANPKFLPSLPIGKVGVELRKPV
jgi:hypothetical protein